MILKELNPVPTIRISHLCFTGILMPKVRAMQHFSGRIQRAPIQALQVGMLNICPNEHYRSRKLIQKVILFRRRLLRDDRPGMELVILVVLPPT